MFPPSRKAWMAKKLRHNARPPVNYSRGYTVGAVAQSGERLNGIQEVRGSIPLGSTSFL